MAVVLQLPANTVSINSQFMLATTCNTSAAQAMRQHMPDGKKPVASILLDIGRHLRRLLEIMPTQIRLHHVEYAMALPLFVFVLDGHTMMAPWVQADKLSNRLLKCLLRVRSGGHAVNRKARFVDEKFLIVPSDLAEDIISLKHLIFEKAINKGIAWSIHDHFVEDWKLAIRCVQFMVYVCTLA